MFNYVSMEDSFMSGWGLATGKKSIYQIKCETSEQIKVVVRAAAARPDMTCIQRTTEPRVSNNKERVDNTTYNSLGKYWKEYE